MRAESASARACLGVHVAEVHLHTAYRKAGLDFGLDIGLDYGLHFGLNFVKCSKFIFSRNNAT